MMRSLLRAAAELYALEPWRILDGEAPIEVRYPLEAPTRLVVVMGSRGDIRGLCAYHSLEDLRRMLRSEDPLQAAGMMSWLAFTYDSHDYLAPDDRGVIEGLGWHLAGEEIYPVVARIGSPGPELRSPALEDLVWLEGVLWGLVAWFRQAAQMPAPAEFLQNPAKIEIDVYAGEVAMAFHPVIGGV